MKLLLSVDDAMLEFYGSGELADESAVNCE